MSLLEQINADMKSAMKAKEKINFRLSDLQKQLLLLK